MEFPIVDKNCTDRGIIQFGELKEFLKVQRGFSRKAGYENALGYSHQKVGFEAAPRGVRAVDDGVYSDSRGGGDVGFQVKGDAYH